MTFAFLMPTPFKDAYRNGTGQAALRAARQADPERHAEGAAAGEDPEMTQIRFTKENRFAVGSRIAVNSFDRWVKEKLTGLNSHASTSTPSSC